MSNVNTVTLSGNITRDPEAVEGHDIAKFGLAVNRRYKKQGDDDYTEEVSFFDCTVFGGFAALVLRKLRKGQPVTVSGRLKQETWETDDGKRSKIVVIVQDADGPGFYVKDEDVPPADSPEAVTETGEAAQDEIPF